MQKRTLGRSKIEVNPLGMGCWAIGGPFGRADGGAPWQKKDNGPPPGGLGYVDDAVSRRAVHTAIDLGIQLFDTADSYGCGHSEEVLGRAFQGKRDQVIIATKFGNVIDEQHKLYIGHQATPEFIRQSCENSLRRLQTDYIDLYQFHWHDFDGDLDPVLHTLESLVAEGKIRWYGWSTDDTELMANMAQAEHCAVVQHALTVFYKAEPMLALCDQYNLGSINRSPLGMGILSGKYTPDTAFDEADIRRGWNFRDGWLADRLKAIDSLRDVLTCDGRTLVQGALAWIWARHERPVPIPGFKSVHQVEENAAALSFGPLSPDQFAHVEAILART